MQYHNALARLQDQIEVVSRREVRPAGAGETALIVGPPAIANALRDATGRRPTRLPIRSASSSS